MTADRPYPTADLEERVPVDDRVHDVAYLVDLPRVRGDRVDEPAFPALGSSVGSTRGGRSSTDRGRYERNRRPREGVLPRYRRRRRRRRCGLDARCRRAPPCRRAQAEAGDHWRSGTNSCDVPRTMTEVVARHDPCGAQSGDGSEAEARRPARWPRLLDHPLPTGIERHEAARHLSRATSHEPPPPEPSTSRTIGSRELVRHLLGPAPASGRSTLGRAAADGEVVAADDDGPALIGPDP